MGIRTLSTLLFLTLLLPSIGCKPPTSADSERRAESQALAGNLDAALRNYQSALELARKEGADPQRIQSLEQRIADVRTRYDNRFKAEVDSLLAQARTHAQAKRWSSMLAAVQKAEKVAKQSGDQTLISKVDSVASTKLLALARTSRTYVAMRKKASWNTWYEIFNGSDWFLDWQEYRTVDLAVDIVDQAGRTGEMKLMSEAADMAKAYNRYILAMETRRARERTRGDNEGWLGALADVLVFGNELFSGMKFDDFRKAFETHLTALLNATPFPELPAPAAPPIAAAPAAQTNPASVSGAPVPGVSSTPGDGTREVTGTTPVTVVSTGGAGQNTPADDAAQLTRTQRR